MEPNYIFSFINGIREIFPERKTFEQGRAVPDSSKWLSEWNSTYTCFFFHQRRQRILSLYHLPQTELDWFTWELDMCDRDSCHFPILFKDGEAYWMLEAQGILTFKPSLIFRSQNH